MTRLYHITHIDNLPGILSDGALCCDRLRDAQAKNVMSRLEGHYLSGYGAGDDKPDTPVHLLPDSLSEAEAFLIDQPET